MIKVIKWTRRDLNPRPLRCERNDLPLIYEPFCEKENNEKSFPERYPVLFSFSEAIDIHNLNILDAGNFCKGFFCRFSSAFLVINDQCNDQGL